MNTLDDKTDSLDDRFIDRIVDGELSPAELRMAIDRLDREADGWKRCAVAFIEAQCWRESLCTLGEPLGTEPPLRSPSTASAALIGRSRRRWHRGLIAAGIVAASFAMGWLGHAALPSSNAARMPLASSTVTAPKPIEPATVSPRAEAPAEPSVSPAWREHQRSGRIPTVAQVIRTVGQVRVGSEDAGADVPILAGPGINEQWLRNQPPPLNEYRQVALQRQGYHVDQSRRLVTTTLADGRRVTIPIDQVQIRFTGNDPL